MTGNSGNSGNAVANLVINNGGLLRLTGSNAIFTTIDASRNTFSLDAGSEVDYNSASAQDIYPLSYANLSSRGGGAKTLSGSTTVDGVLNLESGNVILGANTLTLGPAGSVTNASSASYVRTNGAGVFERTVNTSPSLFPVGLSSYNPATLARAAGSAVYNTRLALDQVRTTGLTGGSPITASVVNRTWDITGADVGDLTVTLEWVAANELTSFQRTSCYVSRYAQELTIPKWVAGPSQAASGPPYTATVTGIMNLSAFAIGSEGVLPTEVVAFDAELDRATARLIWRTTAEYQNDHFALERSPNATDFREIGRVPGAGTTTTPQDYAYTDHAPLPGLNYYRLRQVDHDGTAAYHKTVAVDFGAAQEASVRLFPAPVREQLNVQLPAPAEQDAEVLVLNMQGQVLHRAALPAGTLLLPLDISALPAGQYYVRIPHAARPSTARFLKL